MSKATSFNVSGFSRWINSPSGRVFRILAGLFFLILGLSYRGNWWGIIALLWSFFPLTAGLFDICYISLVLGGPLQGAEIRAEQTSKSAAK